MYILWPVNYMLKKNVLRLSSFIHTVQCSNKYSRHHRQTSLLKLDKRLFKDRCLDFYIQKITLVRL